MHAKQLHTNQLHTSLGWGRATVWWCSLLFSPFNLSLNFLKLCLPPPQVEKKIDITTN